MEEDVTSLARRWMFVRLNERFPSFSFLWFTIEEKAPFRVTTRPTWNDHWLIQQPQRPPVLQHLVKWLPNQATTTSQEVGQVEVAHCLVTMWVTTRTTPQLMSSYWKPDLKASPSALCHPTG